MTPVGAIQSGYAQGDRARLYYEVAGVGPPVFLLHPGQIGRAYWDREFEVYSRTYRVVRYDARGYGLSDDRRGTFANWADLAAVLDALGLERASLVGLSLGGRTIADFALAAPGRVACAILVNPGLSGYAFTSLTRYESALLSARQDPSLDAYTEVVLRMWLDGPARSPHEVDAALRTRMSQAWAVQFARDRERNRDAKLSELNAAARLREIRVPMLIVEADLDQPDIHAICDQLAAQVAGAKRVRIPHAAHCVNLERPREFDDAVLPFLAELARE